MVEKILNSLNLDKMLVRCSKLEDLKKLSLIVGENNIQWPLFEADIDKTIENCIEGGYEYMLIENQHLDSMQLVKKNLMKYLFEKGIACVSIQLLEKDDESYYFC